ncbi:MAG: hypothetical protein E6L07_08705 [Verrucomicrobia bacterium]|nr:MAG: hypothetical protein E6L07_08705 [Verrucomicrobiota bacterium]
MGLSAGKNLSDNSPPEDQHRTLQLPRTLVISFPRSGLNWLRHCTEHFSGRRTPGRTQIVSEGPTVFDRAHDVTRPNKRDFVSLYARDGAEIYQKVALLLRDPCDCFISHYLERRGFSFRKGLAAFEAFPTNIAEFDRLRRTEKAVFYFEDFANQEKGTFAFLHFLGLEPPAQPYDFGGLIESSRAWYRNMHGPMTNKRRPALTVTQRAAIRKMLQRRLATKFQQYLGRYYEPVSRVTA